MVRCRVIKTWYFYEAMRRLKLFLRLYKIHDNLSIFCEKNNSASEGEKAESEKSLPHVEHLSLKKSVNEVNHECSLFLKQSWVLLNTNASHREPCRKLKDMFSLIQTLIPKEERQTFEADYKKHIASPISRSVIMKEFNSISAKLSKRVKWRNCC